MKKKIIGLIPLLVVMQASAYLEKREWEVLKKDQQVAPGVKSGLDALFAQHPDVQRCMTDPAMKISTPITGPSPDAEDTERMKELEKQGFKRCKGDEHFLEYQTTPNRNFPGTYDFTIHESFDVCPVTKTINWSLPGSSDYAQPYLVEPRRVIDERTRIFKEAGIKNLDKVGNITFIVSEPPCVVHGTSRLWTTPAIPQAVSRVVNAGLWADYFKKRGYDRIRVPKTRLYHFEGQPDGLSDNNWAAISDLVTDVLSPEELIRELQKPEAEREQVFAELQEALHPDKKIPLWDAMVHFKNEDGSITITNCNVLFRWEGDGDTRELIAYLVDTEGPSLAGPRPDEQRSAEFSSTHLPLYGPKSDASIHWRDLVQAAGAAVASK